MTIRKKDEEKSANIAKARRERKFKLQQRYTLGCSSEPFSSELGLSELDRCRFSHKAVSIRSTFLRASLLLCTHAIQ